ncbi:MAG TPA: hypothetical protein VH969_13825 [Actinophytocola sp.]|uniref:hypothetical protein n=1 Tax=Actinophytocola sp. TaxID=1872138 RepID=UPI002F93D138
MPDTSSAPFREHTATWRVCGDLADPCPVRRKEGQLLVSGIEPIDETWFDASDCPVDTPLFLLIPAPR